MKRILILSFTFIFAYTLLTFQNVEVYASEENESNFTIVCNYDSSSNFSNI